MPPPTPIPYSPSIPSMDPNLALLAFLIFVAKLYNLLKHLHNKPPSIHGSYQNHICFPFSIDFESVSFSQFSLRLSLTSSKILMPNRSPSSKYIKGRKDGVSYICTFISGPCVIFFLTRLIASIHISNVRTRPRRIKRPYSIDPN